MKLTTVQIEAEVKRYRESLEQYNRDPTAAETAEEEKQEKFRANRLAGFMGTQTEAGRKILSEGTGSFDPNFNARRLREVA